MRKKNNETFFTGNSDFTIPARMLPPPQPGFIKVSDLVAKIKPADREAIARAYRAYLRANGGAA